MSASIHGGYILELPMIDLDTSKHLQSSPLFSEGVLLSPAVHQHPSMVSAGVRLSPTKKKNITSFFVKL